jgi:hypothetical protein
LKNRVVAHGQNMGDKPNGLCSLEEAGSKNISQVCGFSGGARFLNIYPKNTKGIILLEIQSACRI